MRWRWPPEKECGYRRRYWTSRPTIDMSVRTRSWICGGVPARWRRSGSAMMSPTGIRGFNDDTGSWKMSWM
jgi:hypothetical protein